MARTIEQIYNEMVFEKESMATLNGLQPNTDSFQTFLSDLTTQSKVATWRLMLYVVAVCAWSIEKLFDTHRAWIDQRELEIIPGTTYWYQQRALEYQHGDSLQFIDGVYKYPTVNPAAKIVTMCNGTELGGATVLKVARKVSGETVALTAPQLAGFQAYIKKVKFAGAKILPVSRDADLLKIYYKVYYNPLVMNPDGSLVSNPSVFPVEDAINNYCVNLPFDGVFTVTALTDLIQQAAGVSNPVFQSAFAKYAANPYAQIQDYYNPNGGYLKVDPAFPLSTTIQYISL